MKKNILYILFAIILLISCGREDDKNNVQSYLDATFRLYQERFDDTSAIAELLTKGLAKYPENIALLQSRGDLYCSRGMLKECRADTERLLKLRASLIEARMMLCMLDEFEGKDEEVYGECYREVVALYAAQPQSSSPDKKISDKFSYVFALLMAKSPDAEKEKVVFLASVASEPRAWIYHGVLDNFDRERALREIFGK